MEGIRLFLTLMENISFDKILHDFKEEINERMSFD